MTPPSSPAPEARLAAPRSGGQILVDQLVIQGVDRIYGVPGESFLAVLDALVDSPVSFVTCRQEGGAAMMAEAYGKLTGRPGVCFVTRGPGATNASAGVHIAHQDSTPMILFIGQASREVLDREAFQEVDFRQMFAPLCKWAAQIDRTERIPEYVSRAFHAAMSGRPGPVVLSLPEDMLTENAVVADVAAAQPARPAADEAAMRAVREQLQHAKAPLLVVGGGGWTTRASDDLAAFADAFALPTVASFRCQDYLDNDHARYAGDLGLALNPALAQRFARADLLLVAGARLGEVSTRGYTLVESPTPRQALVHVHADSGELGRVFRPTLAVNASAPSFFAAARALPALPELPWRAWAEEARQDYLGWNKPAPGPGPLQLAEVVAHLRDVLPPDAIVTNGAGNYTAWLHRFFRFHRYRTQLAPTSGSMGYGLPAAVAASHLHADRPVICFAGDGCFLMHGQELATAVQHNARPIVIVVNNGSLATIRAHQERRYPGRVSATTLRNPDFAALARAFGAHGETVEATADFAPAFERARASGRAAVIELKLNIEALTPSATLTQIRAAALKK
jgi:acetolactate synthase-1/2/3 large subunit